jgi:hypothetical protein
MGVQREGRRYEGADTSGLRRRRTTPSEATGPIIAPNPSRMLSTHSAAPGPAAHRAAALSLGSLVCPPRYDDFAPSHGFIADGGIPRTTGPYVRLTHWDRETSGKTRPPRHKPAPVRASRRARPGACPTSIMLRTIGNPLTLPEADKCKGLTTLVRPDTFRLHRLLFGAILCGLPSARQNHALGLRQIPGLHLIEVDSGGHPAPPGVQAVPLCYVRARALALVHQSPYQAA